MKEKFKDLLFVLILGSISVSMLLGIRAYTLPIIKHNQEVQLKAAILEAAEIPYTEEKLHEIFDRNIKKNKNYYLSANNFYIFPFEGRGLWGLIKGMVSLNPDLETIERVRIIFQEETPGLGGRIGEESYLSQFRKKKVSPRLVLVQRRKAEGENEVDAISGATISSQALLKTINDSVIDFRKRIKP